MPHTYVAGLRRPWTEDVLCRTCGENKSHIHHIGDGTMPHAFRHSVPGSQFCGACGHRRDHTYHFASATAPAIIQEDDGPSLIDDIIIGSVEAVVSNIIADDSPISVDSFSGGGGDFGGGGSSDGW